MCLLRVKYDDKNALLILKNQISKIIDNDTIIICIGTDRCVLDSLGPVVGKMLENLKVDNKVYGIIGETVNAANMNEKLDYIKYLHPRSKIVAVDASIGSERSIGQIQVYDGPITPGEGVGKKLPSVGDYSIIGVVSDRDLFSSKDLDFVVKMAEIIALSITPNREIEIKEQNLRKPQANKYSFTYDQGIKKVIYIDDYKSYNDTNELENIYENNDSYYKYILQQSSDILLQFLFIVVVILTFL